MEQQEQQQKEADGEVKYECPDGRAVSQVGSGGGGSAINTTATVLRLSDQHMRCTEPLFHPGLLSISSSFCLPTSYGCVYN